MRPRGERCRGQLTMLAGKLSLPAPAQDVPTRKAASTLRAAQAISRELS